MVQPWHVGINCSLIIKLSYNTKPHHIYMFTHLSLHKQSNVQRTNNSIKRRNYKITLKYIKNEKIQSEEWFKNGERYRVGGAPVYISYFENRQVEKQY